MDRIKGRGRGLLGLLTANTKITIGVCIIAFFVLIAILAPLLTHYPPSHDFGNGVSLHPSWAHPFGTTTKGEDIYTQVLYGTQTSLLIGFASAIGSTILQILFGLTSGYFGGLADDILTFVMNVFLVLPGLPLAIVVVSLTSGTAIPSDLILILVLTFTTWSYGARVLRSQTMSLREREFVTAARASGETNFRIIFAEIMPNEIALVVSNFVTTFAYTVLAEVALEFLGLGNISGNSWGVVLFWAQSEQALSAGAWWWFVPPGLCVAFLCVSLTLINFGIDELANPRLRRDTTPKSQKEVDKLMKNQEQKKEVVSL
jgi:peptide/nickel transport system permease protein